MINAKQNILDYFHHLHHDGKNHEVNHCGGAHLKNDADLDYEIFHCQCGKHRINKKTAIGHDFYLKKVVFEFTEECPQGGWHLESGIIRN